MKKWGVSMVLIFVFAGMVHSQWLETTINVPDSLCGMTDPQAFTYNAMNNKIYVGGRTGNNVIVIDGATNEKIAKIPAGPDIIALCWNSTNDKVYCANYGSNTVTVIDGVSNSMITTIPVGKGPYALVSNPTNNKVYCANSADTQNGNVTVIDGGSNNVIATIPVGSNPQALLYNPTNSKVYCANYLSDNVTVIDVATNSVITTIPVDSTPRALVYNPTNNKVYCANYNSKTVTVIDGASDSVMTTITVGDEPCAFAWNLVQNRTYVANSGSSSISVIRDVIGIDESPVAVPLQPKLSISPNPFTGKTEIKWLLPEGNFQFKIYDATGKAVKQWDCRLLKPSGHIIWSGTDDSGKKLPAGVYFCRLENTNSNMTQKVILMK